MNVMAPAIAIGPPKIGKRRRMSDDSSGQPDTQSEDKEAKKKLDAKEKKEEEAKKESSAQPKEEPASSDVTDPSDATVNTNDAAKKQGKKKNGEFCKKVKRTVKNLGKSHNCG